MISSSLLGLATFTYLACMALYFCLLFVRSRLLRTATTGVTLLGLLFHSAGWAIRWYESYQLGYGHIPLANMYEALISLAWTTVVIYLVIEFRYRIPQLGSLVLPMVSLAMAYASLAPGVEDEISPLIPALQCNWLTYHVLTCFLGYSAFAVSFGASIVYLVKARRSGDNGVMPAVDLLDEVIYRSIAIGFLLLGIGIITGAVWANYAWGSYWSWDPKETWSLITWFIYAAFIHARLTRGWRGKKAAVLSILGFICVLFTFLGVNYLLAGLHSYA